MAIKTPFSTYDPLYNLNERLTPDYNPLNYSPLNQPLPYLMTYPGSDKTYILANPGGGPWRSLGRYQQQDPEQIPKSFVLDYNDPMDVNSFADVLLNTDAIDAKYKGWFYDIPLIGELAQRVVATGDLIWRGQIEPLINGRPDAALLNLVTNVSESLDIIANPVKGLIQEGPMGAFKALGMPTGEGRPNYNWDTGNIISDIVLEVVSDPLNLVSFGGSTAGKMALRVGAKEALEQGVSSAIQRFGRDMVNESITDTGVRVLARDMARSTWRGNYKAGFEAFYDMAENIGRRGAKMAQEQMFKNGKILWTPAMKNLGVLQHVLNEAGDYMSTKFSMNLVRSLQGVVSATDNLSRGLFNAALATNGLGLELVGAKAIYRGFMGEVLAGQAATKAIMPLTTTASGTNTMPITKLNEATRIVNTKVAQLQPTADALTDAGEKTGADLASTMNKALTEQAVRDEKAIFDQFKISATSAQQELENLTMYVSRVHNMTLEEYGTWLEAQALKSSSPAIQQYALEYEQLMKRINRRIATESKVEIYDKAIAETKRFRDVVREHMELVNTTNRPIVDILASLAAQINELPVEITGDVQRFIYDRAMIAQQQIAANPALNTAQNIRNLFDRFNKYISRTYKSNVTGRNAAMPPIQNRTININRFKEKPVSASALVTKLNSYQRPTKKRLIDTMAPKSYTIKVGALSAHLQLKDIPIVKAVMAEINSAQSDLGKAIHSAALDPINITAQSAALRIINVAQGYRMYDDLIEDIFHAPETPIELKLAVLDALERRSKMYLVSGESPAVDIPWYPIIRKENIHQVIEDILRSSEVYANSIAQANINTMDALRVAYKLKPTEFPAHTTANDVLQERELLLKVAPEAAPEEGKVLIVYDAETTGTEVTLDEITELGWVINDGQPIVHYIETNLVPPASALRKMYNMPTASSSQLHAQYMADRSKKTLDTAERAITDFIQTVEGYLGQGLKVNLGGHNIKAFDNAIISNNIGRIDPLLRRRLETILHHPDVMIYDTLEILRKKATTYSHSSVGETAIRNMLEDYIKARMLMNQTDKFPTQLHEQINQQMLDTLDEAHAFNLTEVATKQLKDMREAVAKTLQSIEEANDILDASLRFTADDLMRNQLLNTTQLTHQDIRMIARYNAVTKFDLPVIQDYFRLRPQMPPHKLERYQELGHKLNNVYRHLAPSPALDKIKDRLGGFIHTLQQYFSELDKKLSPKNVIKAVRIAPILNLYVSPDPRQRLALAGYLWHEFEELADLNNELYTAMLNRIIYSPSRAALLNNIKHASSLYINSVKFFTQEFNKDTVNIFDDMVHYNSIVTDCTNALDPLKVLNKATSEDQKLFISTMRAATMSQRGILETNLNLYEKILKLIAESKPARQLELTDEVNSVGENLVRLGAEHVLNMSLDAFKAHLWHNAKGALIIDTTLFPADYEPIAEALKNKSLYKDEGIEVELNGSLLMFRIDPDSYDSFAKLKAPAPIRGNITITSALPLELNKAFEDVWNLHNNNVYRGGVFSTGNIMSTEEYKVLYNFFPKNRGDEFDLLYGHGLFKYTNMDYSVYLKPTERFTILEKASGNIFKQTYRTAQYLLKKMDSRSSMIGMFADLNNPMQINNLFSGLSDREILNLMQSNKYWRLGYLIEQNHKLVYKSVRPSSIKDVQNLKKLHAVPVDAAGDGNYRKLFNSYELTDKLAKSWVGTMTSLYKGVYLVSPTTGLTWLFNNFIDSFGRAALESGGFSEMGGKIRSFFLAHKAIGVWNDIKQEILDLSRRLANDPNELWTPEGYRAYFANPKNSGKQGLYDLIEQMLRTTSGGQTRAIQDALTAAGIYRQSSNPIVQILWNNWLAKKFLNVSMRMENTVRLGDALYRYFDEDQTAVDAVAGVLATHYDYTPRNQAEALLEYIIPFSTFKLRNMTYWMDVASSNGWLLRIMNEMMIPIFNQDEYDHYELSNNRSLLYAVSQGNIVLDNNMTIKTSSTAISALNILLNPGERTIEGLYAPMRVTYDMLVNMGNYGTGYGQYDILKNVAGNLPIPFLGIALQQYWGIWDPELEDYQVGSAVRANRRTDNMLPLLVPGSFGSLQRSYFYHYGNGTIYMTHNRSLYESALLDGATTVRTYDDAYAAAGMRYKYQARPIMPKERKTFSGFGRYRRSYARGSTSRRRWARRSYTRNPYRRSTRGWFRGTYASRYYGRGTYNRVMYRVRSTQYRMPSTQRNLAYTAPAIYRRLYSGGGTNAFKARLLPVSYKNVRYRLRQGWAYLR